MMKRVAALTAVLAMAVGGGLAAAHDYTAGEIEIMHPWTRATPPNAQTAGGYLELRNEGAEADQLIGGHSPLAERVEIHSMTVEDGVMRMRPVGERGVTVNPGETVALEPGGLHIMLIGLKAPLKAGDRAPLTLEFRNAGSVDVELAVQELGSRQGPGGSDEGKGHSHQ